MLNVNYQETIHANNGMILLIKHLQKEIENGSSKIDKYSRAISFFSNLVSFDSKEICSHYFCQKFLGSVITGIKMSERNHTCDDKMDKRNFFESLKKNYSMFCTI